MKYRALVCDLDGTVIPNRFDGKPSQKLVDSVQRAKSKVSISLATGRPHRTIKEVVKLLQLTSPCIVNGGARIVDVITGKVLHEKLMDLDTARKVLEIILPFKYEIVYSEGPELLTSVSDIQKDIALVCLNAATKDDSLTLLEELEAVDDIVSHPVQSWTKDHIDLHITNIEATKKHALEKLLEILEVKKEEAIGVGDSNNDFALFHSVGLKVAMGNATQELKKVADYIAPSVEDDGVVNVIEKFILKK